MLERCCYVSLMENKKDKNRKDINELAFSIVQKVTDENSSNDPAEEKPSEKNPAAVAHGPKFRYLATVEYLENH
jgi:hypothetical protein